MDQRREVSIFCKAVAKDLREIFGRLAMFSMAPASNPISGDLETLQKACRFIGFSGGHLIFGELAFGARLIENGSVPQESIDKATASLGAMINAIGRHMSALEKGGSPRHEMLSMGRDDLVSTFTGGSAPPTAALRLIPSIEVDARWRPPIGASKVMFLEAINNVLSTAGTMQPIAAATDMDLVALRKALVSVEAKNVFKATRMLSDMAIAMIDTVLAGELMRDQCLSSLDALLEEYGRIVGTLAVGQSVYVDDAVASNAGTLLFTGTVTSARAQAFRHRYGGDISDSQSRVDSKTAKKFVVACDRLRDAWAQAVAAGNVASVKAILEELVQKSPVLNSRAFTCLAGDLLRAVETIGTRECSSSLGVAGAIAIMLMKESAERPDADADLMGTVDSIASRLTDPEVISGRATNSFIVDISQSVLQPLRRAAVAALGAALAERINLAKNAVDAILFQSKQVDEAATPEKIAEVVGGKIVNLLAPLVGVLTTLRLPQAARSMSKAADVAHDPGTWATDEGMLLLFEQLTVLAEFGEQVVKGFSADLELSSGADNDQMPAVSLVVDRDVDSTTRVVFLVEAREVIAHMNSLQGAGREEDPVDAFRRGFHTLKGSGRVAGLNRLAYAAEACQMALETPGLGLDDSEVRTLVALALRKFEDWIAAYSSAPGTTPYISNADIDILTSTAHALCERRQDAETDHLKGHKRDAFTAEIVANEVIVETDSGPSVSTEIPLPMPMIVEGFSSELESKPTAGGAEVLVENVSPGLQQEASNTGDSNEVSLFSFVNEVDFGLVDDAGDDPEPYRPVDDVEGDCLSSRFLAAAHGSLDEIDPSILPVMCDEASTVLPKIGDLLEFCMAGKACRDTAEALKRHVHTLKGCTRTAGLASAGAILHAIEDHMDAWGSWRAGVQYAKAYEVAIDHVAEIIEKTRLIPSFDSVRSDPEKPAIGDVVPNDDREPLGRPNSRVVQPVPSQAFDYGGASVRVTLDALDALTKTSNEAVILSTRSAEEITSIWTGLTSLGVDLERMTKLMQELEIEAEIRIQAGRATIGADATGRFDSLELDRFTRLQEVARSLSENLSDIRESKLQIATALKRLEDAEVRKTALADNLHFETNRMMVKPLDAHRGRLERVIRKACQDAGVKAAVSIYGDTEAPAAVIEKLLPIIEHVLRNAVAHGIETPDERRRHAKPEVGRISLIASSREGNLVLAVQDDGRGIDSDRVLQKAREAGLAGEGHYSESEIYEFLFRSGFSTAKAVSKISGRGVGLDAVRAAVSEIGGSVEISSKTDVGTRFSIVVPADISTMSVVPVIAGDYRCLIPAALVDRIVSLPSSTANDPTVFVDGIECSLVSLQSLVGDVARHTTRTNREFVQAIVCGLGTARPMAIQIDTMDAYRKVVVRPLGSHIAGIPGLIAGTVYGDGSPLLIVNPMRMVPVARTMDDSSIDVKLPLVMIADDSSTVRLVTSRFLRKHGYDVVEAKDGLDAMEVLRSGVVPDVFLLDIEMPRMDGFELVRAIRHMPSLLNRPIIMITSRTAQKHREYATQIGANAYIGKPYEEVELLDVLADLVASTVPD